MAIGDLIAGQLVECMDTQDISQWQMAILISGQLVLCMEIHRIYHSGKWRFQYLDNWYSVWRYAGYITVATGDSKIWTIGTVYGDTVCQWSSCACSSRAYRHNAVHEAAQNLSEW